MRVEETAGDDRDPLRHQQSRRRSERDHGVNEQRVGFNGGPEAAYPDSCENAIGNLGVEQSLSA